MFNFSVLYSPANNLLTAYLSTEKHSSMYHTKSKQLPITTLFYRTTDQNSIIFLQIIKNLKHLRKTDIQNLKNFG